MDKLGEVLRQGVAEGFREGILHPERCRLMYLAMELDLLRHGNPEFINCSEQEQYDRIVDAIRRLQEGTK